ncbi:MAG: hypothetical protein WA364_16280, partial [Candidatus Nitrosopolaris sp.]
YLLSPPATPEKGVFFVQVPNFVSSPLPILALFLINGEFLACLWFPLCDYSTLADSFPRSLIVCNAS